MITSGDIEFEPSVDQPEPRLISKTLPITTAIVAMTAGDAGFQADAVSHVFAEVKKLVTNDPSNWVMVKTVAQLYAEYYNRTKMERARAAVLTPFGLNEQSF